MLEKSRPPVTRPTTGMTRSLTSESTILPKAPPMITPTARSTTLPLIANSRNSLVNDIEMASFAVPGLPARSAMPSHRRFAALPGANPDDLLDRGDEDLAVADLARPCRLDDPFDRPLDLLVGEDQLHLDLREEVDDVFGAAIELGVALLAAEALHLGHRKARDADFGQRLAHFVELERLDDRFDFFHGGCCRVDDCGPISLHHRASSATTDRRRLRSTRTRRT